MSNTEPRPKVPNTMDYTDEERALARDIQSREAQSTATPDRRGLGWKKPVAAVALLGAVAGAAFGVKTMGGGEANPTPERSPAVGTSATPGETEKGEQSLEFGIPAAEFQNDPEQLAHEYYRQLNAFRIAGVDQEAAMADRRFEIDDDRYIDEISAPIDEQFIEALFVDDWQSNPELAESLATTLSIANRTREIRLYSYGDGTFETTPYAREMVIESVEGSLEPLTTNIQYTESANAEEANVTDHLDGDNPDTYFGGNSITWVNVDGQLKISNITDYTG